MDYEKILKTAQKEAMKAFRACVPTPVSWVSADLDDKPISEPSEPDPDGECGGAYVTALHGKDPFVIWALKNKPDLVRKRVYKGYDMFMTIDNYNGQSAEKRTAFAEAYAKILNENGIKCGVRRYLS